MSQSHGCGYGLATLVPRSLSQTPWPWVPTSGVTILARLPLAWSGRGGACRSRGRPARRRGWPTAARPGPGSAENGRPGERTGRSGRGLARARCPATAEGECHGAGLGLDEGGKRVEPLWVALMNACCGRRPRVTGSSVRNVSFAPSPAGHHLDGSYLRKTIVRYQAAEGGASLMTVSRPARQGTQ
jgi:hypothetical protein